jgi:hypothetical protein
VPASPRVGQDILGNVNGTLHRGEFHDSRTALQSVKGAEDLVEAAGVMRRLLECQEPIARSLSKLARLDQELLQELVHGGTPQSVRASSTSCSRSMGFTG